MDLQLKDKVILVTGGAKGIGAAIVHACAAEGRLLAIHRENLKTFGRLHALVNNAGRNDKVGLEHGSPTEYVASLQRNLVHYHSMAHYALPHLKSLAGGTVGQPG